MVLECAGPKFRPHSVVCCGAVVWCFREMNIFANYYLLLILCWPLSVRRILQACLHSPLRPVCETPH
jgi:hypothetical protein